LASSDSARAISARCFCPGDSVRSGVRGSMSPPTRCQRLAGAAVEGGAIDDPEAVRLVAEHNVRPDVQILGLDQLLAHQRDPEANRVGGAARATGPSIETVPASGRCTPAAIFMSVDLPAPLPPSRPTISPAATSKSTPRSARTPPKDFSTRLSSRRHFFSSRAARPELVDVLLVDDQDARVDRGLHRLAVAEVLQRLDGLIAELERPLDDGRVMRPSFTAFSVSSSSSNTTRIGFPARVEARTASAMHGPL
jgi:hypothetical protein